MCVWAICAVVGPFRDFEFHSSDSRLFSFLPSVSVFKKWRVQQQQRQYTRKVSEEQSRAPTQRVGHETIRKGRHEGPSPTEKSSNTASHGGPSVCAGQPSRGATRHTQQGMTDRQAEREREMDAVKRHSQSTWPVSMRPLHAGTQEKRVRGKKARSSTTHTEETNYNREKHRHGPRPGRQLHTSPHTHTHTIAVPSVRG
ncbi:exo-alpha-sialidase [Trypanosoma cruzi]|nr:exo-alpha-sialidase [Trypanosoma cruzi]